MAARTTTSTEWADVVEIDRYPIGDLNAAAGRELVDRCRAELAEHGVCNLAGFIRPGAVAEMAALADRLAEKAWPSDQRHTVYFEPVDATVPAGHPRAATVRSAKHGIAYDYIPASAPIRRLYESEAMTRNSAGTSTAASSR